MNDQEKIAVLRASIANIGRLIPAGMTITFSRDPDTRASVMAQTYPNGEVVKCEFTSHAPIYSVPVVPAEYGVTH